MILKIEKLISKKALRNEKPFHKADVQETWADIEKAKKILSWVPEINIDQGLSKTIDWYLKNKHWIQNIDFI